MNKTKIAWADFTWNPITGCTPISEGCANCYAEKVARRFNRKIEHDSCDIPWTEINDDYFKVTLHPERLEEPMHRRKPARIFVCSMSDLFHEDVPDEFISSIFAVMKHTPHLTYLILTKRPERMKHYCDLWVKAKNSSQSYVDDDGKPAGYGHWSRTGQTRPPLPNVWLGVTAENQTRADNRIPILLQTPAAKRFVSIEPILGPVDLKFDSRNDLGRWDSIGRELLLKKIDWVIVGGETGPGARECHEEWVQDVYDQCQDAVVPFFFKQSGSCFSSKINGNDKDFKVLFSPKASRQWLKNREEQWLKRREWPK